jgi:hypothetical protein
MLGRVLPKIIRAAAMLILFITLVRPDQFSAAQAPQGATMTVISGQVAVVRPDGSAMQPAPSGTTVFPGDEIRTLTASGALITFFIGTEIEMGADTALVVERVSRQGDQVDVSLKQALGISVSRIQTFTDPNSAYRIGAGGAVALVRGTEIGVYGPQDGVVVFIDFESSRPIPVAHCMLSPGVGVWFEVAKTQGGEWNILNRDCHYFRAERAGGPWNALVEGFSTALQELQGDTRGVPAGSIPMGQQQEEKSKLEKAEKDDDTPPTATVTPTTTPVTAGASGPTPTHTPGTGPSPTPTASPTPLPSECNKPLLRELANQGGGTAGTTQAPENGQFRQTIQVNLTGATANTAFDVYIDQDSIGSQASHKFVGTFTTNASGNAFFTGSILVPDPVGQLDNELVLQNDSVAAHQYIQQSFTPCGFIPV